MEETHIGRDGVGRARAGPDGLRVAIYVHCFYPQHFHGTEAYARALARALIGLGHAPTVVAATPPDDPPQAEPLERYAFDGIPVIRIDRTRLRNDAAALRPVQAAILDAIDPDVIHVVHLKNHTGAVTELAAERGIPVFATLTDAYGICLRTTLDTADGQACAGPSASRANCIACALAPRIRRTSRIDPILRRKVFRDGLAQAAVTLRGALPRRVNRSVTRIVERPEAMRADMAGYRAAFVPTRWLARSYAENGFAFPLVFSPFGTDVDRRPKPSRRPGPQRLGFVGQIAAHKGLHLVLDALRRLDAQAYALEVWGSEQQEPDYAARVRVLARGMPVTFRGTFAPAAMADVFAGIELLVLPSTWRENAPLTLVAALATHTPVVVSDVSGMTDLVEEGVNGVSFRCGDSRDLARTLERFFDDPGLAARMSARTVYPRTETDVARDILAAYAAEGVAARRR